MAFISEDDLEQMTLDWFQEIGYSFIHGHCLLLMERPQSGMTSARWCSHRSSSFGTDETQPWGASSND